MTSFSVFSRCCIAAFLLAVGQAAVAQSVGVTSALKALKVEEVGNKTLVSPAETAKPGDVVEYRAVYANKGAGAAKQLLATVPIPANTTLILNTAEPDNAQGSIDGANFYVMPVKRSVKQKDGSVKEEAVALSEYRALRWNVGTLDAGKQIGVSLRVRINPVLSAANASTVPNFSPSVKP
jgi:uncharacterized repeat protein (TIGR01451 family)